MKSMMNHTKKLRVCLLISSKFPMVGGYENLVYLLSNELAKKADVHIICSELNPSIPFISAIKVHPILKTIHIKYVGFLLFILISPIKIYLLLRKEKFDVINVHPVFPGGFISFLPAKLLDIPLVVTSHGIDIQINNEVGYGIRRNKIISWAIKLTLRNVDFHTVVSKSMINDAIDAGSSASKIRVIYNGIDLQKTKWRINSRLMKKYNIEPSNFIILFLNRLHPKKSPADLLNSFPKVLDIIPNARLIFAGKGEEEINLKQLATHLNLDNNVIFTGFVSDDEKWELMNRCDVFVLPSIVEAFGISLIEAMACKKPCIATNCGPFPEIIRNGKTGLLVPPHSPESLSAAIIKLALNKQMRLKMGSLAEKDVESKFNINNITDDYFKLYSELIKNKRRKEKK